MGFKASPALRSDTLRPQDLDEHLAGLVQRNRRDAAAAAFPGIHDLLSLTHVTVEGGAKNLFGYCLDTRQKYNQYVLADGFCYCNFTLLVHNMCLKHCFGYHRPAIDYALSLLPSILPKSADCGARRDLRADRKRCLEQLLRSWNLVRSQNRS